MLSFLEILWTNHYPKRAVPILPGKGAQNYTNLMSALALNGQGTTHDFAKFVLKNSLAYTHHKKPRYNESRELGHRFRGLLKGTLRKKTGRRKYSKTYSGLISNGYAIQSGIILNQKSIEVPLYSITLKGCFFCWGFDYDRDELKLFIKNAARNHLLFAFLDELLIKTDISFVTRIFFSSIRYIIKQGKIFLDDNISFYFTNFAEAIGHAIYDELSTYVIGASANWPKRKLDDYPDFKNFETLQSLVFYNNNPGSDWSRAVIECYYKTDEELEFYFSYCDSRFDTRFFYKVMREIHFAYYGAFTLGVPKKSSRRLPYTAHQKHLQKIKQKKLFSKL